MSEITKIVQCFLPPMVAGVYQVGVNQNILRNKTSVQEITKTFDFGVDAARFTLNATDIYSVYPPANRSGNYTGQLPHVIFSRRTLPWERTIDGKPPVFQREDTPEEKQNPKVSQPVPWMALLLFDEDEMQSLKINLGSVQDLLTPSSPDTITRPEIVKESAFAKAELTLMEWENETDGCFTIDITKEQFENYIPSMESLSFLAHAKEVSIKHKDKEGIVDTEPEHDTGLFSVLVGNRVLTSGKSHTAIVVSLEGYADYLEGAVKKKSIPTGNTVRLVALAHWNFDNSGEANFLQLVNGIEMKPMKIEQPTEVAKLKTYFESGYAPLGHVTRAGATTISWYQGPFVPRLSPATSKKISFTASDGALRYDRTTGFFDVSFAAAWQLGRILGLQNQEYAKALGAWRLAQIQQEAEKSQRDTINSIINNQEGISIKNKLIQFLGESTSSTEKIEPNTTAAIPEEVHSFLTELYKLNGVPFSYLVPHEFYLEKEHLGKERPYSGTMAVFYLDPNWIEALLDGALSIGRLKNTDSILEQVISEGLIDGYVDQKSKENTKDIDVRVLNVTGFLLRSDIVSGWRGLEILAYDIDNNLLPALRFERIDDDIFLGIFNGNIASITVRQPFEGLHFGVKMDANSPEATLYQKNLKNEDGSNLEIMDGTADVTSELNNGLIKNDIIDIAGLASLMKQKLTAKDWIKMDEDKEVHFTAAEFAYQMVDSPVKREITITMNVS
ncbi:hypothetical protein [uncultured Dokdonia sp.]|uniref:hypothetical protein n=1 Tax=uncultured Dokdonia sp. TaxID=575653 RepID=UPI00263380A0|nr:hypothetical protein [uncultured Dokdonia sp.]